jgi:DNA/RNA endonuclease YhcR with UshA esterase domain
MSLCKICPELGSHLFKSGLRSSFMGLICVTLLSVWMAICAADASPPSELTKPANVITASDTAAIQSAMAPEVKIVGNVAKVQKRGQNLVIDFKGAEDSGLTAVVFERNREAVEKVHGDGLASIEGKSVQITGKLAKYRDKPQRLLRSPSKSR